MPKFDRPAPDHGVLLFMHERSRLCDRVVTASI
jgi:hypothetical protein